MFTCQKPLVLNLALIIATGLAMPCFAEIHVGLSQVDITPPIGGLTTGYSSAKPTDAIHDPVSARVLVLKNELTCVALVVCDLCVYNYLPDLQSGARGGYGASDTTQAEVGAGESLVNAGLVQLYSLQGRLKSAPQRHAFEKEPN